MTHHTGNKTACLRATVFMLSLALVVSDSASAQGGRGGGRGGGRAGGRGAAAPPVVFTPPASMRAIPEGFTLAAGGDLLGPGRPVSQHPAMAPIKAILSGADAAFANLEGNVFDQATFRGYPASLNGGGSDVGSSGSGGPTRSPAVIADLKVLGLDLFSHANNHTMDWDVAGALATIRTLDSLGLTYAGAGASLEAARAAHFFDSPKGKVALVAATSSFPISAPAGRPGRNGVPRPGVNVLRTQYVSLITPEEMVALRKIAARHATTYGRPTNPNATQVTVPGPTLHTGGLRFRQSDRPGLTYDVNEGDQNEILNAIAAAESQADVTVFSIHAHETASGNGEDPAPADFLPPLFHKAIDAGADIIVRHGPHANTGVEIYKGRPIFYGMAGLFSSLVDSTGSMGGRGGGVVIPRWSESVIATAEFRGGRVHEVRLYPVVFETGIPELRSAPLLASPARAQRILEWMRETSRQFGTVVHIENGVGIIRGDGRR